MSIVYNLSTLTRRPLKQTFHSFTLDEYGLIKDFWLHDLLKTLKVIVLWPFINFWPNSEKSSKELGQEVFIFSCQAAKSTLECNKQTHTHTHSTMQTDANTHRHTHTHPRGICTSEAYASLFSPVGVNTALYLNKQLQSVLWWSDGNTHD